MRALAARGIRATGFKPVASGCVRDASGALASEDALALRAAQAQVAGLELGAVGLPMADGVGTDHCADANRTPVDDGVEVDPVACAATRQGLDPVHPVAAARVERSARAEQVPAPSRAADLDRHGRVDRGRR